MYIGAHVSTKGGYAAAAKFAFRNGASAFQYFPKNPRSLNIKSFNVSDAVACAQFCAENSLVSIGHAPYPLNLAVVQDQQAVMVDALLNGLEITDTCGSIGLVVHFGRFSGKDTLEGYKHILQVLNETLQQWQGRALILLENQAGSGNPMGTTFEELTQIRSLSNYPDKIGFCLDTCHAFASGLWNGANWSEVEANGERLGFWTHLKAIHLNDSLYPTGSFRDRHANIGQGFIGSEHLTAVLSSAFVRDTAIVLETAPAADGTHRDEINYIRELMSVTKAKS
ncbi:deoxyribonuclease IV [Paenibacillus psychroresistens]|uniref:Deoxyribonuclease IV n=1 Tax=Paenibacillus psychroresistens TaxID=1778678 RepID=A0A6B8RKK7_9BACL|nr:deoxyribonuclease IV [Paenibacillus psychroresistens]QGQ96367.1 deoxyribonuclease IV [Paenibacillus psychroresistens]